MFLATLSTQRRRVPKACADISFPAQRVKAKPPSGCSPAAFPCAGFMLDERNKTKREIGMATQATRKAGVAPQANDTRALEAAAATRMLVAERILDYSGHVSIRVPGQDAFVIQIG